MNMYILSAGIAMVSLFISGFCFGFLVGRRDKTNEIIKYLDENGKKKKPEGMHYGKNL